MKKIKVKTIIAKTPKSKEIQHKQQEDDAYDYNSESASDAFVHNKEKQKIIQKETADNLKQVNETLESSITTSDNSLLSFPQNPQNYSVPVQIRIGNHRLWMLLHFPAGRNTYQNSM